MSLTRKQLAMLMAIEKLTTEKGYTPSYEELAAHLGLRSVATVQKHIKNLKAKGYIASEKNKSRPAEVKPRILVPSTELYGLAELMAKPSLSPLEFMTAFVMAKKLVDKQQVLFLAQHASGEQLGQASA